MVDLVTQNYIHTLFLYEFGVSFNIATAIRFCLQPQHHKFTLYYQWARNRMLGTNIPKIDRSTFLILFENTTEKNTYAEWLQSSGWEGSPDTKRMTIDRSTAYKFYISLLGNINSQELMFEHHSSTPNFFICHNGQGQRTTEQDFYNVADSWLSMVESTQKIPFEHYNVK